MYLYYYVQPEHLKILEQGVKAWNRWQANNPDINPDLSHADLRNFKLANASITHANLHGVILGGAKLRGITLLNCNLSSSDLRAANLRDAFLVGTNLRATNLSDADLTGADISLTELYKTNVDNADLSESLMGHTIISGTDLSGAIGLETVQHLGPSSIGIDTLYLSEGRIPEPFLRGAGLSDKMIEFVRSIAANPIEFNSCFISYSTKDQEFATRLHADLQASGVRCWFAPHDIKGGKKLHEQIDWAIHFHDRTLLILSPGSINSAWVKTEIAKTRKREVEEKRQILFPIRLLEFDVLKKWECFDADTGTDSAKEIREYFIPDFSNWKDHDSYQKAFKDLLRDLKNEHTKAAPATR